MPMLFFGGGLNESDDLNINPEECFEGKNFELNARSKALSPRPPFDLVSTAVPNAAQVDSIMQMIDRSNVDTNLVVAGGTVYDWDGAASYTSVGTVVTSSRLRGNYWSLDDWMVISDLDLQQPLMNWNGTDFRRHLVGLGEGVINSVATATTTGTTATITVTAHGYATGDTVTISGADQAAYNGEKRITVTSTDTFTYTIASGTTSPATGTITAERSVELYAKYAITWSNRVWLFNIKEYNLATTTTSLNPHMVLASYYEDSEVFDTVQNVTDTGLTGLEAFFMLSPDLKPINGVVPFYNALIISTQDGRLFKLTGDDSSNYAIDEYFPGSGAGGVENMAGIGNDIIYMRKDGGIDTVGSVDAFGDVKADDISRFIENTTNGLSSCITVYDQERQVVYMFTGTKVLVMDKEMLVLRKDISPWSVYETAHSDGFSTQFATYMRDKDATTYNTYFSGASGAIYKLVGTRGGLDGGESVVTTTRRFRGLHEMPTRYRNITGRMEYRRRDEVTATLTFNWGEELAETDCSVTLKAQTDTTPYFGGDFYFGGDVYFNDTDSDIGEQLVSTVGFSPVGKGVQFFLKVEIATQGDFYISRIII